MTSTRIFMIGGSGARWQDKLRLALLALVAGAVLVAAVILSVGLALVLIPVGFVAYLFRRPLLNAMFGRMNAEMAEAAMRRPPAEDSADPAPRGTVTIETDYTVVETRGADPRRR